MIAASRIRFLNRDVDDIAGLLAESHPRAAQYIEQAPALVVLASAKFGSHITYGEVDRFAAAVGAEPRLRDLLSAYGASVPVRKISAAALKPKDLPAIQHLLRLEPSMLSQVIPEPDSQRPWLDGIKSWLRLSPNRKADAAKFSVAWVARHLADDPSRVETVDNLIDFVARGHGTINEKWSWASAMAAVHAWHLQLNDERALLAALQDEKRAALFDTVICKAPLPDVQAVGAYEFHVLRTPRFIRDEGVKMHHCVSSYAGMVKSGRCAIISVRRDGVNVATLEINKLGCVAQLKGHCNAAPPPAVRKACEQYALLHWRPEPMEQAA